MASLGRICAATALLFCVGCPSGGSETETTTESTSAGSESAGMSSSGSGAATSTTEATTGATTSAGQTTSATGGSTEASSSDGGTESSTGSSTGAVEPGECGTSLEGCNEGFKCNVYATEGNQNVLGNLGCFPLDPEAKQVDEPCQVGEDPWDGIDDCVEGAVCWNADEDGNGTCLSLCPLMGDEYGCYYEDAGSCNVCQECAVGLCIPICNPLLDDCPDGQLCVPDQQGSFGCVLDAGDGQSPAGTPCDFVNACDVGTQCLAPQLYPVPECEGASGCCTPMCDWSEFDADLDGVADMGDPSSACELPGAECAPWYENPQEAIPELAGVGACIVP